jgi:hypothetical protein
MKILETTTDIIDLLGGNVAVARLTSTTPKAVSNWRGFNRFPADTFLVIKTELVRIGHYAPDHLWSMRGAPAPADDPARL